MNVRDEVYRDETGVAEPLAASAPVAYRLSRRFCGEVCQFIHGIWQYRRLLGITKSIRADGAFLTEEMRMRARTGEYPRVLVSGCADYAALAYVLAAYADAPAPPRVTVVDLCPTPVLLSRWYARWAGVEIESLATSILDLRRPGAFDLICTHSFFDHFTPQQRLVLMARWRDLLRPGGVVVTSNRVRPDTWQEGGTYDDEGRVKLRKRFAAETQRYLSERPGVTFRQAFGLTEDSFQRLVDRSFPGARYYIGSQDELRGLFENAGFSMMTLQPQSEGERQADRPTNQPHDKTSVRMRMVAVRQNDPPEGP